MERRLSRSSSAKVCLAVLCAAMAALLGCSKDESKTTPIATLGPADIQGEWPLTVQSVQLHCVDGNLVVLEAADGMRYAITGTAGRQQRLGLRDAGEIWKVVDAKGNRSINMMALDNLGRQRCRDAGQFK